MQVASLLPLFASMIIDVRAPAVVIYALVSSRQGALSCDRCRFALGGTVWRGALSCGGC